MSTIEKALILPALVLCVVLLGLALAGCASPPNPALEEARAAVAAVEADTEVQTLAPNRLGAARQALQRADAAWQAGDDAGEIDHLAYLAERRALVAREAAMAERTQREIASLNQERERITLEERERDLERAESELEAARRALAELQARETERGLVLTLGDILFEVDGAELQPGGMQQLMRVADFLRERPERGVLVEGHTDSIGEDAYNLELSKRRANAVQDFLISQGIAPTRIVARGYGRQVPVASNETAAGRQQNRRVEIVILDRGQPLDAALR